MKRLFIGFPIASEKAAQLVKVWQSDPALNLNRLAWTKPSNWHITLAFLGATDELAITLLGQLIDEAFSRCPPYTTALNGAGVFPGKNKPNVLWLGLDNIQPVLPSWHRLIELLEKNNFPVDPKPLKPHLTIARVKSLNNRPSLYALLENNHHTPFGEVTVDRIILYESHSTPRGVVYIPLFEKKLKEQE